MIVFISLDGFYLGGHERGCPAAMVKDRVILEASPEAGRMGVQIGDRATLARRRCPGLEVTEFRAEEHAQRFEEVWSIVAGFTPMVETTDLHQGYLDITHDARRYGGCAELMQALSDKLLQQEKQQLSWGGGTDKWMAWIARGHNQFITPPMESLVLLKLPVETMSLPQKITERLHHYDIHTVADLVALPQGFLEAHLGFDREFVLRRLTRHKEAVHPNFPPPSIVVTEEIVDQDEARVERAMASVSANLVAQLNMFNLQPSSLRLTFATRREVHSCEVKLAQTGVSVPRIERVMLGELPVKLRKTLRSISVQANGLLPIAPRQDTLWGDQGKQKRELAVERLHTRLQARYGSHTLLSGSEIFARQQPRFAQLIYQSRGFTLP